MPRRSRGIATLCTCALVAAGCGSGDDAGSRPQMTRVQSEALVAQLERARVTAAAQDVTGTRTALNAFRAQVARLRRAGAISSQTAKALRTGAVRVLARAIEDAAPAQAAPVQTTPQPAPAPAPKAKGKHGKKKHGKKKGKDE